MVPRPDAQVHDGFGFSVAVSGDIAVVGTPFEDAGGTTADAAYVFGRDEGGAGAWGEVTKLIASDTQAGDTFGSGVALSGDRAVVGASHSGGTSAGAAYVFKRDEGGASNWGEVKQLLASDGEPGDEFGSGVAVSGDTAVVGAHHEAAEGENAGAAYVFQAPAPTPTPKPPDGDTDGDTIPNSSDPDDDNDGCTDEEELQPESLAAAGGGRDPLYFWDFFDTWATGSRTRNIDGFDIGDVVGRFGTIHGMPLPTKEEALVEALTPPGDTSSYHTGSDRDTPDPAANVWNLGPPSGNIDGFDIGFVVVQFGHTCIVLP